MRTRTLAAAVATACAGVAAIAPAAGLATPPEPVVIALDLHFTSPTTTVGTFTSTGAIADAGAASQTLRFADSTVHGVQTMTSPEGTITIRFQSINTATGPATFDTAGRWVIVGGTGAYADLHGTGSGSGEVDLAAGTLVLTYTGSAHID